MTLRTKKRLLILLSLLLGAGAIGVAAWPDAPWGKTPLVKPVPVSHVSPPAEVPIQKRSAESSLTPQDFQAYWSKPLRRPLFDPSPPPPPQVVEKPPPRPIAAKLIATMVEPGNSMAMLQLSTGEVVFRKLGDEIGAADSGAKISSIEEGVIKIIREDAESKLTVPGQGGN
jgi:hypothetical protein